MPTVLENAQARATPAYRRAGPLDWSGLQDFLELSRSGSLSAAARRLGVDRNTVARRVGALEAALGLVLFDRGPQGWIRTAAGDELAGLAGRVEEDVLALARHADAHDRAVEGTVRLTTAMHLAAWLLAPALPALRARRPGILLEIVADQRTFDLTRREADLALRMGRPRDAGLVARKLSQVAYGFYAGPGGEAARRGEVDLAADDFLGFDDSLASVPQERWLARLAPDRQVVFRSNATAALVAAARAGLGVAVLPCYLADAAPGLVRLRGPVPVDHELWLLVHGDLRRAPRVRAVIEWVDELVARARPALEGRPREAVTPRGS
jgi:DNA-binding transcriptional LysR family regulator